MSTKSTLKTISTVVILALVAGGGWYAWQVLKSDEIPEKLEPYSEVINEVKSHIKSTEELPDYIASGNGRIEATEYDIATKIAGRLTKVLAEEGDTVEAGQTLAVIDTDDLNAQLREANASYKEAVEARKYAIAIVEQYKSELTYAQTELRRFLELSKKGHVSQENVDQKRTAFKSADAALKAANIKVVQSASGIEAAEARIQRLKANIDDSTLKSPIKGRVLYRLAEPGEVLASGGKVMTVLDLTDVYMSIFLPTAEAGKVTIGAEARMIIDAIPQYTIPAKVTFVAAEAQFTPRSVETRAERDKLMFRVKVKIDSALLKKHIQKVKTGVPGVTYISLDPEKGWTDKLELRLPE
jgi:HlyD family secretion protein